MKNLKTLFGLTALIAVIIFTLGSCVINVPDDDNGGTTTPNTSLEGFWVSTFVVKISGSTGDITHIGNVSALSQDAINKGLIKIGDQMFRNLTKTGDRTWTGQMNCIMTRTSTPNVAEFMQWYNCTITMNVDGQSFQSTTSFGGTVPWIRQ
jgi:hypothetical protein